MSRGRGGEGNRAGADVTDSSHLDVATGVELAPQSPRGPRNPHLRGGLVASHDRSDLEMRSLGDEAQEEEAAVFG